jgi:hypothetical protein
MPHITDRAVPILGPKLLALLHAGQFPLGEIHDARCRCKDCKPPLVGEAREQRIAALATDTALFATLAALAVAIIVGAH